MTTLHTEGTESGPEEPDDSTPSHSTAGGESAQPNPTGIHDHGSFRPASLAPAQAKVFPSANALLTPLSRRDRRRLKKAAKYCAKAHRVVEVIQHHYRKSAIDDSRLEASGVDAAKPDFFGRSRRARLPRIIKYLWVPISFILFVILDQRLLVVLHLFADTALILACVVALAMEGLAFKLGHAQAEKDEAIGPELSDTDRWALKYAQLVAIFLQVVLGVIRAATGAPISAALYCLLGFAVFRASVFIYAKTSSRVEENLSRDKKQAERSHKEVGVLHSDYYKLEQLHGHQITEIMNSSAAVLNRYYELVAATDAAVIHAGGTPHPWPVSQDLLHRSALSRGDFPEAKAFPALPVRPGTASPTGAGVLPAPTVPGTGELGPAT
jgi:hypothetical protein